MSAPAGPLGVVAAVGALVAFGIVGIGRHGASINGDMRFLYAAGKCWLSGKNPYIVADMAATTPASVDLDFVQLGFTYAYPPQSSWLAILLGSVDFSVASVMMVGLNVAAALAYAWFVLKLVATSVPALAGKSDPARALRIARWFVPIVVLGNPFTLHVVFMGQTSLIAVAMLTAGWHLAQASAQDRRQQILAGLLLGAATMKPQLAFLPLVPLLLARRFMVLGIAGLAALVLAAPALIINGPLTSVHTWIGAVDLYQRGDVQGLGFQHVFGLRSLALAAGMPLPTLVPLGLVVGLLVWRWSAMLTSAERLGLLLAAAALFIYVHDYDLVCLVPLIATLWVLSARSNAEAMLLLGAVLVLFLPQRLLQKVSPVGPLLHWREIVVLALLLWQMVAVQRRGDRRRDTPATGTERP